MPNIWPKESLKKKKSVNGINLLKSKCLRLYKVADFFGGRFRAAPWEYGDSQARGLITAMPDP